MTADITRRAIRLKGTLDIDPDGPTPSIGDKGVALIEYQLTSVGQLTDSKAGVVESNTAKPVLVHPLTEAEAKALLKKARATAVTKTDRKKGRTGFHVDDTVQPVGISGVTDSSGVVMSAKEIAEAQGFTLDPDDDLVCVKFVDGTKAMWPDDWHDSGQTLAHPGGFMRPPKGSPGDTVQVIEILDVDSAQPVVPAWTAEDEERRLAQLEAEAIEAEAEAAAADVAVTEELLAARGGDDLSTTEVLGRKVGDIKKVVSGSSSPEWLQDLLAGEGAGKGRSSLMRAIEARLFELGGE